jgi:7-cyano-7-deazaguanine synthase
MSKAVVLLSGGVDSATCLGIAVLRHGAENVSALSVSYGQKHIKERECAKKLAQHYGVKLYEVDLSSTMQYSNCPLLAKSTEEMPHESYAEQIKQNGEGTVKTYVPFRNGLMLSSAAALALSIYPDEVVELYYGAHADDAAGRAYPDCTEEFATAMDEALYEGSGHLLSIRAPLIDFNKAQVVAKGLAIGVPYQYTWSCYEGGDKPCGVCGTCIDRAAAFAANGIEDPALKEEE